MHSGFVKTLKLFAIEPFFITLLNEDNRSTSSVAIPKAASLYLGPYLHYTFALRSCLVLTVLSSIHPAVSGFSLAFVLLLGWVDVRSFVRNRALPPEGWMPLWGVGIALTVTFLSGYLADGFLYPSQDQIISDKIAYHHVIGRWALIIFPLVAVARHLASRHRRLTYTVAYAVMLVALGMLLFFGGSLGGALVFEHGVGVRRA